ncbi:MAG: Dyp-type peroxidase [Acidimicrobiales bacterium]
MAVPQPGIFAQGTRSHYQLELDVRPGVGSDEVVAALRGLRGPAVTAGGANLVVALGADLARRLALPGGVPDALTAFAAIEGLDGKAAPSTQHDLWIWIHGTGEDVALDTARQAQAALGDVAAVAVDQPCFVYKDSRDLTGFVDGTANPRVDEAPEVACVPDGEVGRVVPSCSPSGGSTTSRRSRPCRWRTRSGCSAVPRSTASSSTMT